MQGALTQSAQEQRASQLTVPFHSRKWHSFSAQLAQRLFFLNPSGRGSCQHPRQAVLAAWATAPTFCLFAAIEILAVVSAGTGLRWIPVQDWEPGQHFGGHPGSGASRKDCLPFWGTVELTQPSSVAGLLRPLQIEIAPRRLLSDLRGRREGRAPATSGSCPLDLASLARLIGSCTLGLQGPCLLPLRWSVSAGCEGEGEGIWGSSGEAGQLEPLWDCESSARPSGEA